MLVALKYLQFTIFKHVIKISKMFMIYIFFMAFNVQQQFLFMVQIWCIFGICLLVLLMFIPHDMIVKVVVTKVFFFFFFIQFCDVDEIVIIYKMI